MKTIVSVASDINRSARVLQIEGMFDVPPSQRAALSWNVDLPIEDKPWNIGLIVGPSGSGKSTVARKLWPEEFAKAYSWQQGQSLLDGFPAGMSIKEITAILSSVGFSSPPAWVRPFHVLSNGEQFRVTMARALAETPPGVVAVVDEFTSVVDRTVAQIGSCAIARTVRARGQQFVAVTCHEDVEAWLQPDWVYRPATQTFQWRAVQRRPPIELEINRVHHSAWRLFHPHHYLTADLNKAAFCFVAFWRGVPVAFDSWLPFFGKLSHGQGRRGHRLVCLPDYQGVGIGAQLFTHIASMWKGLGFRAFSSSSHPSLVGNIASKKGKWVITSAPKFHAKDTGRLAASMATKRATNRLTASFEYVGEPMPRANAELLLSTWAQM